MLDLEGVLGQSLEPMYEFGSYQLNAVERLLMRDGEVISLQPKIFDLLLALVAQHGRLLEKDELMRLVWPDTIVEEANLANNISILRKTLSENGQPFIETVPKRGYRFVAEVREIVTEQNKPENSAPLTQENGLSEAATVSSAHKPGISWRGKMLLVGLGVLLVAGGLYEWRWSNIRPETITSIAILPFRPVVDENRDEKFQMGMTDTLIFKLSDLKQLKVRSIGAVSKYNQSGQDPLMAGREQQVRFVLESTYLLDGGQIRVRTRLLNVVDGTTLWTYKIDERYDANPFVMQDVISAKITAELSKHLTGSDKARFAKQETENHEASRLFLEGRYHLNRRTVKDFYKSIECFEQALKLDPNYAQAYAHLAHAWQSLGLGTVPPGDAFPKARAAVEKALELDEQLAEAYTVRGSIKNFYDWDRVGGEKDYKRALELNPNSEIVHRLYAIFLMITGRFDESLVQINQALEVDPTLIVINRDKAQILFYARRYDQAIEQCLKTIDLDSNNPGGYLWLGRSYEAKSLDEKAIAAYLREQTLTGNYSPEEIDALKKAWTVSGLKGYWRKRIEQMLERAKRIPSFEYSSLASIYAQLGEKEKAFESFERAYKERRSFIYLKIDPRLDGLRSDPRYIDLLQRVNLDP